RNGLLSGVEWRAGSRVPGARAGAGERGMPVGFSRVLGVGADSGGAETWADPHVVVARAHVGAPPDLFNPAGQDWGLPPFHPHALREGGYARFIELLRANMRHAGALRIDHAMALQHVYWIPEGHPPSEGAYVAYPMDDLLGILALESQRNRCLVVGEDLGTVPEGFRERMAEAGVLSYRVMFFEWTEDGGFRGPDDYPYAALATVGSHDLATLRGWWEGHDITLKEERGLYPAEGEAERQRDRRMAERARLLEALADAYLPLPASFGPDSPYSEALGHAVHAFLARTGSAIAMVQMDDLTAELEQVNLPGTVDQYPNWRRKLRLPLEDMADCPQAGAIGSTMAAARPAAPPAPRPAPLRAATGGAGRLRRAAGTRRDGEGGRGLVMEVVGLGVWRFAAGSRRFHGSDRTAALLGVPVLDGASVESWIRNVAADHRNAIRAALFRDAPSKGELEAEFPVGSPDGQVRWLAMRGSCLTDPDGTTRAVGILEDVTERRRAHEMQLGELVDRHTADRRLFAAIIESSTDLIVAVDQECRYILFNGAYQREVEALYGHRPAIGQRLLEMMEHLPTAQVTAESLWSRALGGERFTIVEELGDPTLQRKRYELAFGTILDSSGRRIGAYHVARDVEERERTGQALREIEETLHQARKMEAIGQLTGGIAHDFNNLLQAIGTSLYLLRAAATGGEGGGGASHPQALDMAEKAVERGATLTQHLLAFSRRQRLEPKTVDVGALVTGMGGLLERTLGGTTRIVTETDPSLWPARVDPNQLEMAILNLAINARDAMTAGGTLTFRTGNCPDDMEGRPLDLAAGDCVSIAVADTGSGMSEETAARAFEPFFTTKGVGHGTGLGLSMVHGLAAQSGG
ncbi:4-alpha-glucanotransferase, partial [Azospirillum brasilense]|nr:4-alpha-glucanotransferase [Azospirillum brasilense]